MRILASGVLALIALPAVAGTPTDARMAERLAALESRVAQLESSSARVDPQFSSKAQVSGNWHRCKQGMSRAEVQSLLGRPMVVPQSLRDAAKLYHGSEVWLYRTQAKLGPGYVIFRDDKLVECAIPQFHSA
ncbi:hypothetical protein GCM10027084_01190 [Pseudoxanthomonas sangjuensis]|uniref:outer membrane protein assembly factor BamE n=1 Tax=Pseudoxanthomonas sangjuensis TaxID=1503750 RepID=UPI0013907CED|nr:outer membrane protein assembly factor BamE [Pseudoxanthomonas sangjuensis]